MNIDEFLKGYIDKNDIIFTQLGNYEYTEDSRHLFYAFRQDNPSKKLPNGYVIDRYEKNERLCLVNLNTLVKLEISAKTDDILMAIFKK